MKELATILMILGLPSLGMILVIWLGHQTKTDFSIESGRRTMWMVLALVVGLAIAWLGVRTSLTLLLPDQHSLVLGSFFFST